MNDPDTVFAAQYVLRVVSSQDIVSLADRKLGCGEYSDYFLEIVDSDLKVMEVLSPLLEGALTEIGVVIPDFDRAVWIVLHYHIGLIASGRAAPREQFSRLLQEITRFDLAEGISDYVGDNVGIEYIYGWFYDDFCSDEEIDSGIQKECQKWLKWCPEPH